MGSVALNRRSFLNDKGSSVNEAIREHLTDLVSINGTPVLACLEIEVEKESFDGGPEQVVKRITLDWIEDDCPNVRAGASVIFEGRAYTIKQGFPINEGDCWMNAELNDCGGC